VSRVPAPPHLLVLLEQQDRTQRAQHHCDELTTALTRARDDCGVKQGCEQQPDLVQRAARWRCSLPAECCDAVEAATLGQLGDHCCRWSSQSRMVCTLVRAPLATFTLVTRRTLAIVRGAQPAHTGPAPQMAAVYEVKLTAHTRLGAQARAAPHTAVHVTLAPPAPPAAGARRTPL
jgi:hypothetical protein